MSWWTDNRRNVIMTIVRWGLGYLLGRTAADADSNAQPPLADDGQHPASQKGE